MKGIFIFYSIINSLLANSQTYFCNNIDNSVEIELKPISNRVFEIQNLRNIENSFFVLSPGSKFITKLKKLRPGSASSLYLLGDITQYSVRKDLEHINFRIENFQKNAKTFNGKLLVRAYRKQFGAIDVISENITCENR
ncbi:MAG: hypothetical protein H6622_02045 [Halobacteriovoraceae bacterium]|nr:hypothetical protein [Halobacteriovoraceae bacterium]